jgi:hypothetical protein
MKIEKGIPIPPLGHCGKHYQLLSQMSPGDSVIVIENKDVVGIWHAAKRHGFKVTSRKEDGQGIRVWRTK